MDHAALTAIPDAPDLHALAAVVDPLDRAAAADEVMWLASRGHYQAARDIRRLALIQALEAGRAHEEIAPRLGIRVADVDRLAAS